MPTPLYDGLVKKVRDWSNRKEVATIPTSVIQDCLGYSADESYRLLRVPPLEGIATYTIVASDNDNESVVGYPNSTKYTTIPIPADLTEFIYIRQKASSGNQLGEVFNEVTDARTFFDAYAEKYSRFNWMYLDGKVFIHPQLEVDTVLEVHYYRRLPDLDALYSVVPVNYVLGTLDANQLYLTLVMSGGTNLYFAGAGGKQQVFASLAEAQVYANTQPITTVTTKMYEGKEAPNWLRDQNERTLIFGALYHVGAYLFDDNMEARYEKKFMENIASLNKEEKFRKARGGNVRQSFNSGGLI